MEYCEILYSNKLETLEEMGKFLDVYDLPKLNPMGKNHLNRSIICNEVEAVIVFQQRKSHNQMDLLLNSTTHLKNK
jgi:hypothetical protein